jgi:hypothetical protein
MLRFHYAPEDTSQPSENTRFSGDNHLIGTLCEKSLLFEELLYHLIEHRFDLHVFLFQDEYGVVIRVEKSDGVSREKNTVLGHIFTEASALRTKYKPKTIPEKAEKIDEMTFQVDEYWYQKRDQRLRLREERNSVFAPAGSFVELVLSYAIPRGMIEIRRTLQAGDDHIPHFCAELFLRYAPLNCNGVQEERICVRLDQLQRLVDRRVAKQEVQSLESAEYH